LLLCACHNNHDAADPYVKKGNAKWDANNYIGALQEYDQAIKIEPNYTNLYVNRAKLKWLLKNHNAAAVDCEKAISMDSKFPQAVYHIS
jgi:tetratricopeptide (TPR) repeat protein